MKFAITIPTYNRVDDLRRTCQKLKELIPVPDEVIIGVDCCTDGTVQMLTEEFPDFTVVQNKESLGEVGTRKLIMSLAKSDIIITLDDDSYPIDTNFLEQAKLVVESHPEAAVIVPLEIRDGEYNDDFKNITSSGYYVGAYANCASIVRREVFFQVDSFPSFFFINYSEPDFAVQCYSKSHAIWLEPSLMVRHHFSSVNRNSMKGHHRNARNELWSVWMRCPFPYLIPVSLFRILRQFQYACTEGLGWVVQEPLWWWFALKGLPQCLSHRQPIPWHIYYSWMKLARQPIYNYEDLKRFFNM